MELPISEKKVGVATRRLMIAADSLVSVLQDVLFYFVLSCLTGLMLWSVSMVVRDLTRAQTIHQQFLQTNSSNFTLVTHQHVIRSCSWPTEWCRLIFNCYSKSYQDKQKHQHIVPMKLVDVNGTTSN